MALSYSSQSSSRTGKVFNVSYRETVLWCGTLWVRLVEDVSIIATIWSENFSTIFHCLNESDIYLLGKNKITQLDVICTNCIESATNFRNVKKFCNFYKELLLLKFTTSDTITRFTISPLDNIKALLIWTAKLWQQIRFVPSLLNIICGLLVYNNVYSALSS